MDLWKETLLTRKRQENNYIFIDQVWILTIDYFIFFIYRGSIAKISHHKFGCFLFVSMSFVVLVYENSSCRFKVKDNYD